MRYSIVTYPSRTRVEKTCMIKKKKKKIKIKKVCRIKNNLSFSKTSVFEVDKF